MLCPACGNILQKLSVTTKQGGRFEVDHCGRCGGTWFDPYEINRIPYHEVMALSQLTVLPKKNINQNAKQLCPQDHLELFPLTGDAVPKGVKLLSCKKCLGIWATQKDLWEFKKHQDEIVSAYDLADKFFPNLSVVFVPALTLILLLFTTFTTITGLQNQKENRVAAREMISGLSVAPMKGNTLAVSFKTAQPMTSVIYLGDSELTMTRIPISEKPATVHTTIVRGLVNGKSYTYQIEIRDESGNNYRSEAEVFITR
ncbi:MAG: hypothetical protein UV73_C0014G0015 [Candidatus Gottesmanbacteria bacterium GW2011_GWA2_43_14]|uniref:Transcription factor zinc-finger domain-containing protein n=1 Tax=Candidatus Gottesmanbacteria bacterium GW2011_GWA2_43_14 TaxID=1618443 RepID=A0A0G1G9V0_9BACT|nr:MAG: hypothetical protein UV73_C0014G0015 [Candidatus Gottesmanbacteria bacterium GW2011_GWA2_43_14]